MSRFNQKPKGKSNNGTTKQSTPDNKVGLVDNTEGTTTTTGENRPTEENTEKTVESTTTEKTVENTEESTTTEKTVKSTEPTEKENDKPEEKSSEGKEESEESSVSEDDSSKEEVQPSANEIEELIDSMDDSIKPTLKRIYKGYTSNKSDRELVGLNVELFTLLTNVINKEFKDFKPLFDEINELFVKGKKSIFNEITLSQADYLWSHTKATSKTYHTLITLISALADPNTREKNLKTIKIPELPSLTEVGNENLIKYYESND